jgi:hypothetical protein
MLTTNDTPEITPNQASGTLSWDRVSNSAAGRNSQHSAFRWDYVTLGRPDLPLDRSYP